MTQVNEIRELTMDETDRVSGGNPVLVGIVIGWAGEKVLDRLAEGASLYEFVKEKAAEKSGQKGKA